ncbi:hypothetical protein [Haloarcula onubensis]|uniref:Uncharacterized protein n=1 Tax=Haloarcula onubensis TaxID=2950539 RepID=A0ABU2FLK5_9EURY|nr:hypothetical protein [Halomicroarcula sp. S3CR25-11]MDS0281639.1 hypothetical protein [Halomicroarcula sp. S3CR25-11]
MTATEFPGTTRRPDDTVPAVVWGTLYGHIGLFIAFGVAYIYHRRRS